MLSLAVETSGDASVHSLRSVPARLWGGLASGPARETTAFVRPSVHFRYGDRATDPLAVWASYFLRHGGRKVVTLSDNPTDEGEPCIVRISGIPAFTGSYLFTFLPKLGALLAADAFLSDGFPRMCMVGWAKLELGDVLGVSTGSHA